MRSPPRFAARPAWCAIAVACLMPTAIAEQDPQGPAVPPAAKGKLEPLPPAPVLLEKMLEGLLEAAPGRETLDDVMRRAAERNRARAAAAEAAQRQQFLKQQAMQFEQMLQPLLAVELAFAKRACGSLAPAARREVFTAARQAVRDVAARLAKIQFEGSGEGEPPDVRREIHRGVATALETRAAAAEFAAYERESRLRRERREEAARLRIVAKLDEQLGLSAAQRRAVAEALRADWQPTWIRELEDHDGVMINDYPPAPDFADASITPHLEADQRAEWRRWREVAGSDAVPRNAVDWTELNVLQSHAQAPTPDGWWRP